MGHEFRRAGMSRMSLRNHRTTRRKRRGGVAAGDRKCQWKIAGAEYRYRTHRNFAQAQIAARGGVAIRQRAIDTYVGIAAIADLFGKQLQLTHGARAFPRE